MVIAEMRYVVDTHTLIGFLEDNPKLGNNAKNVLSNPLSQLVMPAVALAEAAWTVEKGKTSIPSTSLLMEAVDSDPRLVIFSLTRSVVEKTLSLLSINEMHDRQIVAVALTLQDRGEQDRGEEVRVLTCDQNITESGLVEVLW
ncbi:MAG: PIN domain-containing protein [Thermostichus sp. HHBFW_bins_43]